MALVLKLEPAGGICDPLATIIAAIDSGVSPTPDLLDSNVGVDELTVEIHGDQGLLDELALLEAGGSEVDVVGVPLSGAIVGVVGGGCFINHRGHTVRGLVAIEHLNLVTVLQVHAAVSVGFCDPELHVQSEITKFLNGHQIGRAELAAVGDPVIGHHHCAAIHGIFDDGPLDRQRGLEARSLPVGPLGMEHFLGPIKEHLGALLWFGSDADMGRGGPDTCGRGEGEGEDSEGL